MSELIPRIPSPSINSLPPPVIRGLKPPVVDALVPPVVNIPSYEPPSYEPPTLQRPPAPAPPPGRSQQTQQSEEEQVEEDTRELQDQADNFTQPLPEVPVIPTPEIPVPLQRPEIEVPFVGAVPLPQQREVMLAGTTAVGATAAALIGKSLVEQLLKIFKPIAKKLLLKLKDARGKRFTDYELQQYFNFEGQKALEKHLAKEQKAEKQRQLAEAQQRQHQHKR